MSLLSHAALSLTTELGIDIPAILSRTKSILTLQLAHKDMDNLDLGGPLIFLAALGFAHLLVGKLHFGYILGWTVVGSLLIWFVVTSMAGLDPDLKNGDAYSACCTVGYAILPLVFHAAIALLLPRRSLSTLIGGAVAILWSAHIASTLFSKKSVTLEGQRVLIWYPCLLMYSAFALLTLY